LGTYNAVAALKALFRVVEVHGTTNAVVVPIGFAHAFAKHLFY